MRVGCRYIKGIHRGGGISGGGIGSDIVCMYVFRPLPTFLKFEAKLVTTSCLFKLTAKLLHLI